MTDLSDTILPKSDQLNADDLRAGPRTITIRSVRKSSHQLAKDQPIAVFYEGEERKPFYPCKGMRRVMVDAWGPKGDDYVGKSMTLYRDPEVKYGGIAVGGIRISHMSDLPRDRLRDGVFETAIAESRAVRKVVQIHPLQAPRRAPQEGESRRQTPIDSLTPDQVERLKADARVAADNGTAAFRTFWNKEKVAPWRDKYLRADLKTYQERAAAADRKGAPTEADPFTPDDGVTMDRDGEVDDPADQVVEREPGEEG